MDKHLLLVLWKSSIPGIRAAILDVKANWFWKSFATKVADPVVTIDMQIPATVTSIYTGFFSSRSTALGKSLKLAPKLAALATFSLPSLWA